MKDGKLQEQYLHEGVTVDEGKKYIVTSWWRENSWDGAGDERMYSDSKDNKVVQKVEEPRIIEEMQNKSYIVKGSSSRKRSSVFKWRSGSRMCFVICNWRYRN